MFHPINISASIRRIYLCLASLSNILLRKITELVNLIVSQLLIYKTLVKELLLKADRLTYAANI